MSIHDTIGDALTVVRNGIRARKNAVEIPFSGKILNVMRLLKDEGYIENVRKVDVKGKNYSKIKVVLKYDETKTPAIDGLRRISRPGLRVYTSVESMPQVLNGLGVAVISTQKGMMSDKKARSLQVGGEVICYVW
ncbi:MAG: 30S ribosomal protein S8 [Spirochaetes bacterium]|nr:30S ribosomal protein S8 [Spirochaetota bacterium]